MMHNKDPSQDQEFKIQGNKLYIAKKYNDALECYTKAIVSMNKLLWAYYTEVLQENVRQNQKAIREDL